MWHHRLFASIGALVITLSVVTATIFPTSTSWAASTIACASGSNYKPATGDCSPASEATSYVYFQTLSGCIGNDMYGDFQTKASEGGNSLPSEWFNSGGVVNSQGYTLPSLTEQSCADIMVAALKLWGFGTNYEKFLKGMGYSYNISGNTPEYNGTGNGSTRENAFKKEVESAVYGGKSPTLSGAGTYYLDYAAFTVNGGSCQPQDLGTYPDGISNQTYLAYVKSNKIIDGNSPSISFNVSSTGSEKFTQITIADVSNPAKAAPVSHGYAYAYSTTTTISGYGTSNTSTDLVTQTLWGYAGKNGQDLNNVSCDNLAKGISANAAALITWQKKNPSVVGAPAPGGSNTSGTSGSGTTCVIDTIGWIICPVVNFLAKLADGAFGFLASNFLTTSPKLVATDSTTYKAWQMIQAIANVMFVIVFLIIIFSQLTGAGVSNYGVKKMLPRLIIGAVLVNISFYICQIVVDVSNILGGSLADLFNGLGAKISTESSNQTIGASFSTGGGFTGVAGGILASAALGVALYALLGTLIPVLIAAVLALVMILFMLVGREALIVLLIIVSPLAFVAYLLPNTENWFKRWRQALTAMLLLYPIIALVFGVSQLASNILSSVFSGDLNGDSSNFFGQIMAAAILVLPLFVVPILLKKSLDGIPAVGKLMGGLQAKANGNLKAKTRESYQNSLYGRGAAIRKQARQSFRDKRLAARLSGGKLSGVNNVIAGGAPGVLAKIPGVSKISEKIAPLGILGAQKAAIRRAAEGTAASAQSEEVKQEISRLNKEVGTNPDTIQKYIESNHMGMNSTQMEAASDHLLSVGGVDQYRKILGNSAVTQHHMGSLVASGRRNDGEVRKKAADIANMNSNADSVDKFASTGYNGAAINTDSGKSYVQEAYEKAEAGKLISMSKDTASLAESYIRPDQAEIALDSARQEEIKVDTRDILKRVAGRP